MTAQITTDEDGVAGADPSWGYVDAFGNLAHAGGVDEYPVALAAVDDLGVSGDDLHAHFGGRLAHRLDYAAERLHRKAFFENEPGAEPARLGTRGSDIISIDLNQVPTDFIRSEGDGVRFEHQQCGATCIHDGAIHTNARSQQDTRVIGRRLGQ